MPKRTIARWGWQPVAGCVFMSLSLAGCAGGGGGGGGSTTPTPTVTNPPPQNPAPPPNPASDGFRTAEYQRLGVLDQVHAADAYAMGYNGQGVIIGVVDFNFNFSSTDVNYNGASVGLNQQMVALYDAQVRQNAPTDFHGEAVAQAAAAMKNDIGIHGIAYGAQVLGVDYFSDVNETRVTEGGVLYHVSDPWSYITSHGGRIVNVSYGYEASDVTPGGLPQNVHEAYVLDTPAIAVERGALLVTAAGNSGGAQPMQSNLDIISDLTTAGVVNSSGIYSDSGGGGFIIAGAVGSNNQIASFSDRAGTGPAKNFYLVAPGVNLTLPWNGTLQSIDGTSFSAPLVSGAAAIIMQRWPNLSARSVAQILFDTADDLGAPGVDSVYGHGLLDLYAALQPAGATALAVTSAGVSANNSSVNGSGIVLSTAFGDAPALKAALKDAIMFDSFGRDFPIDASGLVSSRPSLPDRFEALEEKLAWRGAAYAVGGGTSFSFSVRSNTDDAIRALRTSFGPQIDPVHPAIFQLQGGDTEFAWNAGSGLSLSDALNEGDGDPFAATLTEAFRPMLQAPGFFGSGRYALGSDSGIAFGFSTGENDGITGGVRTPYRNAEQSAAVKLDSTVSTTKLSLELGEMLESGGFMGSLAAGGLRMSDQASTQWATISAETPLGGNWMLKAAFTGAETGGTHPGASLIGEIGPVFATGFSIGIGGRDVFRAGDALTFTFDQPLRVEQGSARVMAALGRDWSTGGVTMEEREASLVPSGRELALESGYHFTLAGWDAGANLAFRHDADNVAGREDVTGMFWFSRAF